MEADRKRSRSHEAGAAAAAVEESPAKRPKLEEHGTAVPVLAPMEASPGRQFVRIQAQLLSTMSAEGLRNKCQVMPCRWTLTLTSRRRRCR